MCAASANVRGHLVINGAGALHSRAASMASQSSWLPVFPAGSDIAPVYWCGACAASRAQPCVVVVLTVLST